MSNQIECPVDNTFIDEYKVRVTASLVFISSGIILSTQSKYVALLLVIDFFTRSFKLGKYSPYLQISTGILRLLKIAGKPTNAAPKRFATTIGLIISAAILIALLAGIINVAEIFAIILLVFSFLESFLGFCAGCYIYTFYRKLFIKQ